MSTYAIDLTETDPAAREVQYPHGIAVRVSADLDLYFPAELPADALRPLLAPELGLVALLGDILDAANASDSDAGINDIIKAIFRRPTLPLQFMDAVEETYSKLLDEDNFAAFIASRPSVPLYIRLTTSLAKIYGVELGKLFRSDDSSTNAGATSNPTSPASTTSTPGVPGFVPDNPDSSDFDG
ncbi:hypothetical protein [Streptomyces sp. NPDC047315]|uniref:hypothetical protein n=1 Tax=Streptomyces sp. NPDC047315 TaxID=3155142 RepID=UPI0033F831CA